MAQNRLKTYSLSGGEDLATPDVDMADGMARTAHNIEQNYNTGYTRINGYRPLTTAAVPGAGPVRGVLVYNNAIYMFRDKDNGVDPAIEGGMWLITPDVYRIGNEADLDPAEQWGLNIVDTVGSFTEITDIKDVDDEDTTLLPGGYYQYVVHNFKASARGGTGAYLGVWDSSTKYIIGEQVTYPDGGALYIALQDNKNKQPDTQTNHWVLKDDTISVDYGSHNITGNSGPLYGADGMNPAFEFDGTSIKQINSGYTPNVPHHIEANGNRLALGFREGEIALSVVGDPFSFDAVFGAGSIGTTDWLTGMMAGPDGSMYIFCKDKSYIFKNGGGPLEEAELRKHNKNVGAYPYTNEMLAGHALFFDTWGLTELEATDVYGDVITNSITANVQEALVGTQPVIAAVYRDKAQYRLWFKSKDSTVGELNPGDTSVCIIVTLIQGERMGITHAVYPINIHSANIGEYRSDTWNLSGNKEVHIVGTSDGFIYQMDVGNNFYDPSEGGTEFDRQVEYTSYLTLPFNYMNSPHKVKKFKKMMVNVESVGFSDIKYSVDFSFGAKRQPKETGWDVLEPTGGVWGDSDWSGFYWGVGATNYMEGYINGHSENIAVTITNTSRTEAQYTLKDISFIYEYLRVEH